jgi:hypothetical protein
MLRKMPRSFFWLDQKLIRSGLWAELSREAKLFYVALSAGCDREGRCLWGQSKLIALSGAVAGEFDRSMTELAGRRLIDLSEANCIQLLSLDEETVESKTLSTPPPPKTEASQVIVHTHFTVNVGKHA